VNRAETIISGETLIIDPHKPPLLAGALVIKEGLIADVGERKKILKSWQAEETVHKPTGLIMPGLINCHTHAPMTLLRGIADDLPLKEWLENHIFPAESRLTSDLVHFGTELACAEMIRAGITSFVDMYLFEDSVAEAAAKSGMRAWVGEGIFDFPTPAFSSGEEALEETLRLYDKWQHHPRITITVDPHTPYTCSKSLLEKSRDLSEQFDLLIVTHLAETSWEDGEIRRRFGTTPARYLDSLGLITPNTLAAHCVCIGSKDIELLSNKGACVAHCPESNLKLGSGIAPVVEMLQAKITVTLGTDGTASNNDLDMLAEMDTAAKLQKGVTRDPTVVSAHDALAMATTWAAKALKRDDIGRLEKGCQADLAILDLEQVHLRPTFDPISHIVYAAKQGDVTDLMVAGKWLMRDRLLTTLDENEMLKKLPEALKRLGLSGK